MSWEGRDTQVTLGDILDLVYERPTDPNHWIAKDRIGKPEPGVTYPIDGLVFPGCCSASVYPDSNAADNFEMFRNALTLALHAKFGKKKDAA